MPFLIFVIFVGLAVYRSANKAAQNTAQKNGQPEKTTPVASAPRQTNNADRTYQGVSRPGAEGYAPAAQRANTAPQRPAAQTGNTARPDTARRPAASVQAQTAFAAEHPTEKQHTPIQPTVHETERGPAGGSLHYASQEGTGSVEGTASTEGECIEENPQHCAVEHLPDDVYDVMADFSEEFDRKKLLRAMIMGEVLNAPKWKTN